jgi:spore maturation protein CgeB
MKWGTFNEEMLHKNMVNMGHQVELFEGRPAEYNEDLAFTYKMNLKINESACEAVFSFDFFPIVSDICQMKGCLYLSWVFDCPHSTLFSKSVFNEVNRIFSFDRDMYQELIQYGIKNIFHLELAVDTEMFRNQIDQAGEGGKSRYQSELSFVGGMYTGEYNFYDQIQFLPEYTKGYLEGIITSQEKIYGYNFIKELLSEEIMVNMRQYVKFDFGENYFIPDRNVIANMLNKKVTVLERREVLKLLSEKYNVNLFSRAAVEDLPRVNNRGCVDYKTEMPLVFHYSKINLNITLRSITSGIPLRALDIMACGGFLLSNYQPELAENFIDGEEIVLYTGMDDLLKKVDYYLKHNEEREKIARAGYEKIKNEFSYQKKLNQLFSLL